MVYAIAFNNPFGYVAVPPLGGVPFRPRVAHMPVWRVACLTVTRLSRGRSIRLQRCVAVAGLAVLERVCVCVLRVPRPRELRVLVRRLTCVTSVRPLQLWNSETGQLYHTYRGHATEIVCLSFDPRGTLIATGSMDNTAKLWDVETGKERCTLMGHTAEIVSLNFNTAGDRVITGSFDHTVKVWDVKSGKCVATAVLRPCAEALVCLVLSPELRC